MATSSEVGWEDEEEDEEEQIELDVPDQFRDLEPKQISRTVNRLAELYVGGRLSLQPEFQREYVWDEKRASRFIESLLLNLPVPPIFVAENDDGSFEVVDGHQRLQSLFGFLRQIPRGPSRQGSVPTSFKALKLKGLEVLCELNGDGIDDLPVDQRERLMSKQLHLISIPKRANPDLRFVLFERLNLGSVPLNAQELRNCIYRGPYNDLIRELSAEAKTLEILGKKTGGKRMKEREQVLSFFALLHSLAEYRVPFTMFLNEEMEKYRDADTETIQEFRWQFHQGCEWTKKVFRQNACLKFEPGTSANVNGGWSKWNQLIFEVQTVTAAENADRLARLERQLEKGDFETFLRGLRSGLLDAMCGSRFRETFNQFVRSPDNTRLRFSLWRSAMSNALERPNDVISRYESLREAMSAKPYCCECMEPISSPAVDARLLPNSHYAAHRYCYQRNIDDNEVRQVQKIKQA